MTLAIPKVGERVKKLEKSRGAWRKSKREGNNRKRVLQMRGGDKYAKNETDKVGDIHR